MKIIKKVKNWLELWKNQFLIPKIINRKCNENYKVLIIKLDAIGDFIIWLDSAKEYKGIYPSKECTLLCNAACKSLADATGYFDEVLTIDIKKFEMDKNYRNDQMKKLGMLQFGILIQTAYSRTQHMDFIAASIPASYKIGFQADESKSNLSRFIMTKKKKRLVDGFYDKLIPTSKCNLMELQRNKEFIRGLGKSDFLSSTPVLPYIQGVDVPEIDYFIVFPGASTGVKRWGTDGFASTINYIQENKDWYCIVCGGKDESFLFEEIKRQVKDCNRLINYCGKTGLVELIEIVRNAKIVLSNDTSGIHYAAALGVQAVCPFGEYNYGRFLPYECDNKLDNVHVVVSGMSCRNCASNCMTLKCITHILKYGSYLCVDTISIDSVIEQVDIILEQDQG